MVDRHTFDGPVSGDKPTQLNQSGRNAAAGNGASPQGGFNALVPELDVSDIAASLRFWCDLLGFHIVYDRPAAGFAFLQREGAQVMLCQVNGEWVTGPLERPYGRGINFQIECSDVTVITEALNAAAWPLFRPVKESWYRIGEAESGAREFLVQDPDGYLVRFSQSIGTREVS
ncbi:VOC family protein [Rhizobiales bacterium RZME27]|jgi:catechol 2,3-dioxygenase-like lactoylglutathione lyase family enzyme|uniref:Bleomycin resistance protein n=1 Tax=Endobacterium cereale TaxID=2663029 RepID=A0A6A8AJA7_9HYPH|nr:VOC family protein [Endobacterium cereale]